MPAPNKSKVSIDLSDFINLLNAAELGITAGQDFRADHVLRAWKESFSKLNNMPLDDGKTQEERNQAFNDHMHEQAAKYGSN